MSLNIRISFLISVLLGIVFFFYTNPFYVWHYKQVRYVIEIVGAIIMLSNLDLKGSNSKITLCFLLVFYLYIIIVLKANFFGSLLLLSFLPLPFIKRNLLKKSFDVFYKIYTLFLLLSVINYVLWLCGIPMPYRIIEPFNTIKTYEYIAYPFLVIPNQTLDILRFHGIYEEPGNVGTISALLICSRKLDMKDWKTWSLILGGLLSLSLFFYIIIIIYLIWTLFLNKSKLSYRLLFCIIGLCFAYACFRPDTVLSQAIGNRLHYDKQSGTISGNNRNTSSFENYLKTLEIDSPILYLGSKLTTTESEYNEIARLKEGSASLQSGIIDYGLIAFALYFIFYLLFMEINNIGIKERLFIFSIIFLTIWQRPFILSKEFNLIFCMWIISCSKIDMRTFSQRYQLDSFREKSHHVVKVL